MLTIAPLGLVWAASLSGSVRSAEDGDSVYGATVSAVNQRLQIWQTTTGLMGGFQLEDLPEGTWRLYIAPPQDVNLVGKFVDSEELCDAETWTLGPTDQVEDIEALLPAGGSITGQILDTQGAPLPEASVWAAGAESANEGRSRGTRTDSDGHFEILGLASSGLTEGEWVIWVSAEGWPDQYLGPTYDSSLATRFVSGPGLEAAVGSHTLLGGITVQGTVQGPDGPAPEASVHVYAGGQVVTVETDSDGVYLAEGLPPGDVLPWASAEDLATTYYPNTDRPTEFLSAQEEGEALEGADLFLPWESTLQLQLLDPVTGEPVPELSALLYNDTHTVGWGDSADEDGILRFDSLHEGAYELYTWGSDAGFSDDWTRDPTGEIKQFSLGAETESELSAVDLVPAAFLQGQVLDEDGNPIGSAWVIAQPDEGNPESTLTDSDGRFSLSGLSPQSWSIEALVSSACPGDPAYVNTWWPAQVNGDWAPRIELFEGEGRQGLELHMPYDGDLDGMGDEWEDLWSLDPTRNDAQEDPDGDGYLNLTEYILDTNPQGEGRGCSTRRGHPTWTLLLVIPLLCRRRR